MSSDQATAQPERLESLIRRLRRLEGRLGRRVRVLLIGNIANNAFHLGKMLNKIGIACDCVCYDYYHIMGCPEWEDADFDGDVGDQFRPDWTRVEMQAYRRPRWFVQGPLRLCIRFLEVRNRGDFIGAEAAWRDLSTYNLTREHQSGGRALTPTDRLRAGVFSASHSAMRAFDLAQRAHRRAFDPDYLRPRLTAWASRASKHVSPRWRPLGHSVLQVAVTGLLCISRIMRGLSGLRWRRRTEALEDQSTNALWSELLGEFARAFPDRLDRLTLMDLQSWSAKQSSWSSILPYYDVVQGFSIDPIHPMLAGKPYYAFEHGTLRSIPAQPDAMGRLTSLAYHKAEHVFVTNSDCLPVAHKLAPGRVTFINHPFDEDDVADIAGWQDLRKTLCQQLDADQILFHPTRHDWIAGTGYADKANDVFLRAFADLRKSGLRVGAVLCSWGQNVEASRRLLADEGVLGHVAWEKPMPMRKFFRTAKAAGIVVDQFKLGAIGGVAFKALAAGVGVCTRLDEEAARATFGEAPPVVNCATTEDLVARLSGLLRTRQELDRLGEASRQWFMAHHSGKQVLRAHLDVYLRGLEKP